MNTHLSMWQVIQGGADRSHHGMSDDQQASEYAAMRALFDAMAIFELAAAKVNNDSSVVKIDLDAWKAFVHDELPSPKYWQTKINEARDVP